MQPTLCSLPKTEVLRTHCRPQKLKIPSLLLTAGLLTADRDHRHRKQQGEIRCSCGGKPVIDHVGWEDPHYADLCAHAPQAIATIRRIPICFRFCTLVPATLEGDAGAGTRRRRAVSSSRCVAITNTVLFRKTREPRRGQTIGRRHKSCSRPRCARYLSLYRTSFGQTRAYPSVDPS